MDCGFADVLFHKETWPTQMDCGLDDIPFRKETWQTWPTLMDCGLDDIPFYKETWQTEMDLPFGDIDPFHEETWPIQMGCRVGNFVPCHGESWTVQTDCGFDSALVGDKTYRPLIFDFSTCQWSSDFMECSVIKSTVHQSWLWLWNVIDKYLVE